ncbi:MAG: diacylglycerol kinase family protein [Bacteroidetes bacterium]|nr:diacylglycerol kinase family protein [Bacteroidota bacterium]
MNFKTGRLFKSFGNAFKGLINVIGTEPNFRIHLVAACLVIATGIVVRLNAIEWCMIIAVIFLVLAMEVINTAIEKLVDFVSPGFHVQAGVVKDISAAAVLLTAVAAVIVGLIIFLPRLT